MILVELPTLHHLIIPTSNPSSQKKSKKEQEPKEGRKTSHAMATGNELTHCLLMGQIERQP